MKYYSSSYNIEGFPSLNKLFGTKYFEADGCACVCTIKNHILEEFLVHCIIEVSYLFLDASGI